MNVRYLAASVMCVVVLAGAGMAESNQATYTGIDWAHQPLCWVDDTQVVFLQQNKMNLPAEQARPKGLYLFDVTQPAGLHRLDLAPLPASIHEEIGGVECQNQTIVFYRYDPGSQTTENYAMRLGNPPELITKGQGWQVSIAGQYLLSSRPAVPADDTHSARKDHKEECAMSYLKAGFIVHCWDFFLGRRWPLAKWVLADYRWEDTLTIREEGGKVKRNIPNPTTPLLGKDGKPLLYGLHLRDLTGKILANLNDDPKYAPWVDYGLPMTPDESYVYAACSERANPIGLAHIVCRYRLDGQQHDWEEVFRSDLVKQLKASIVKLSVPQSGDVYFQVSAKGSNGGIWRFDMRSRSINQVLADTATHLYSKPRVSPNSRWLLYVRSGQDGAKLMLLPRGAR